MRTATKSSSTSAGIWFPKINSRTAILTAPKTLQVLAFLLAIALLAWLGLSQLSTPEVVPASAAETDFSAERAMEHLRVIAAEPRPSGSSGHAATRQYLIDELQSLGLETEVQSTTVVAPAEAGQEGFSTAAVENVIARIPGTDSTGAIAIDAHYDSGATGPGAMDAGAGVVATLEAVRALQAGPALKNDVIVVFADAEEIGMLGANAFNQQHRWAKDVQLTLNFEGAGGDGVAVLYATSKENGWIVSEFLDSAPDPAAYSLLPTIVHLYPDARLDCDLGEFTDNGSAGLGFVSIGDTPAYHTVRDNPDLIDPGSIQQMGGYTLAAARHFGNLDLTDLPQSGDRVFFNVLPGVVAHYAATWVIPLTGLITAMVLGLLITGYRRSEMSIGGLTIGAVTFLLGTVGATVLALAVWAVIRMLNSDYQVMLIGTYQSGLYVVALIFVTIAAIATLYTVLGGRLRLYNLAGGALLGSLIPLWFASLVVPGMSYLVAWPVLFALVPLAWMLLAGDRMTNAWWRVVALVVATIPAMILVPGTLYAIVGLANRLEGLMGVPLLGIVMIFIAPLVALFVLHLDFLRGASGLRRWAVPVSAALVAVILLGWGNATSGYDAEQPRPDRIAYEMNADSGRAQWVSRDQHLDSWTAQFFPADVQQTEHDSLLTGTAQAFMAEAPIVPLESASLEVISDTTDGDVRTISIRLDSEHARVMVAGMKAPGEITNLSINGQAVEISEFEWAEDGEFPIVNSNVPANGWELTVSFRSTEPIILEIEEAWDGLPEQATAGIPTRPPETMPAPDYARDPTIVKQTFSF